MMTLVEVGTDAESLQRKPQMTQFEIENLIYKCKQASNDFKSLALLIRKHGLATYRRPNNGLEEFSLSKYSSTINERETILAEIRKRHETSLSRHQQKQQSRDSKSRSISLKGSHYDSQSLQSMTNSQHQRFAGKNQKKMAKTIFGD